MKRISILLISAAVVIISCTEKKTNITKPIHDSKLREIENLAAFEYEMTKNKEGIVPTENLRKVKKSLISKSKSPSSTLGLEWEERGPSNVAGRTRAFVLDPNDPSGNTLWAGGASGGLWKCTNFKTDNYQWTEITSYPGSPAISDIIFDPADSEIMYVSTGEGWFNSDAYRGDGIYKSTDGGITWSYLESTSASFFPYVQKMKIIGNNFYACTRNAGVVFSFDRGTTWFSSLNNSFNGFSNRAADIEYSSQNNMLYAAMGYFSEDGIYASPDLGFSWEFLPFPFEDYARIEMAIAPSNEKKIYALVEDGEDSFAKYVVRSFNGGESWDTLPAPAAFDLDNFARNQAWYDLALDVDPSNEDHLIIGGVDLLESFDGGESWQQISQWFGAEDFQYVHADQHRIQFLGEDKLIVSNDGGIWYSEARENNIPIFNSKNEGYNITQFYTCTQENSLTSAYILAGAQDNGTQFFLDEGINSTGELSGGDGGYCFIDSDNSDYQVASFTYNNYFLTTDGWETWDFLSGNEREGFFINPSEYDHENNILYASAEQGSINIIDMDNPVIDSVFFPAIGESKVSALKVHPVENNILFLGTNEGEIFKVSVANASSAEKVLDLEFGFVRNIDISSTDPSKMIFTVSNFDVPSIYYSSDGGNSWTDQEGDLPNMPVRWGAFNPDNDDQLLLGTEMGIWTTSSINGDQTSWAIEDAGLPLVRVDMLRFRPMDNFLIAATYGRGLFSTSSLVNVVDNDNDGFADNVDCDDDNPSVNPGAEEVTYNGIDDDCDTSTLDDDLDQDGFNANEDCDDDEAAINPDADEVAYNGIDDDCDPMTLDDDLDQDGFGIDDDCDDEDPAINPDAEEIADNNIDENCDGEDLVSSTYDPELSSVQVYPNPTQGLLNIKSKNKGGIFMYQIFNSAGVLVLEGEASLNIDLKNLPSASYVLKIGNGKEATETIKIIKL